jgi:glycosyltransferase involved in cell wall biosynthesis
MTIPNICTLPVPGTEKSGWPWTEETPPLPPAMPDGSTWPKISIVTPSYNQAQYLEETIRSVLLQGYPNLEYIIIDGGSTDGSVEIIKKYEPWLAYWISEPDGGQTYAINKGIQHANGTILNWLNSDDFLYPGALSAIAEAYLNNKKEAGVICANAKIVNKQGEIIAESLVQTINPEDMPCPTYPSVVGGIQASWFFTSAAWLRVNGLNLKLNYTMDTDLYFRFQESGATFTPVNYFVAAYRTYPETKTRHGWKESAAFKKRFYRRQLSKVSREKQNIYRKRIQKMFFAMYLRGISANDSFFTRLEKLLYGIYEYPRALFYRYQIMRCIRLLLSPPKEVKTN